MTWTERALECQTWYTQEKRQSKCSKCGRQGSRVGIHPSGKGGQPMKRFPADLEGLQKWMSEAGWMCASCGQAAVLGLTGGGGISIKEAKRGVREIRRRLLLLRQYGSSPELCAFNFQKAIGHTGSEEKAWEFMKPLMVENPPRWLPKEEFQALLDKEAELLAVLIRPV